MNLFDVGIGVAIGLGLASDGCTFAKIGSWLSAKAKLLEAQVLHTNAVTAAVASSPISPHRRAPPRSPPRRFAR